jgi:hypothetical protein
MLKTTGKIQDLQLGAEFQGLIGTDWVQVEARITIPEMHFVLRKADNHRLIEIVVDTMQSVSFKGLDYIDTSFTLHSFNIRDHTFRYVYPLARNDAPFPNLMETYIPTLNSDLITNKKNALNLRFI